MADKGPQTHAEIDKIAIEKYNRILKESKDREIRLHRHYEWRGNKLPPFNIEPFGNERQRLAGMTAADRTARKQWLMDQRLAPNEPRFIAELYPMNPFRRAFAAPWNLLFKALTPVLGSDLAGYGRFFAPRIAMSLGGIYFVYYYYKYHPNDWTGKRGWHTWETKDQVLPNDERYPNIQEKDHDDFFNKGFKERNVLLDVDNNSSANVA